MATSEVAICVMAMQKLGAGTNTVTSLDPPNDSKEARACRACFAALRDAELRAHTWSFAKKRATLATQETAPEFDFDYAFPVPTDFLRLITPNRNNLDWAIENVAGVKCIVTNDGDSLEVPYIARIADTTLYDPEFDEALACKIAEHLCEEITQSNTKKADAKTDYKAAISRARRTNAIESISAEPPEDPWVSARR